MLFYGVRLSTCGQCESATATHQLPRGGTDLMLSCLLLLLPLLLIENRNVSEPLALGIGSPGSDRLFHYATLLQSHAEQPCRPSFR